MLKEVMNKFLAEFARAVLLFIVGSFITGAIAMGIILAIIFLTVG